MGSTSFLGFSYPNLLLVISEPVIFRNLYHIFLVNVGTFSGSFLFYLYFISVPYFGLACVCVCVFLRPRKFVSLPWRLRKRRVLDRGQDGF